MAGEFWGGGGGEKVVSGMGGGGLIALAPDDKISSQMITAKLTLAPDEKNLL